MPMHLTIKTRSALEWWISRQILEILMTDASLSGQGGCFGGLLGSGNRLLEEQKLLISIRWFSWLSFTIISVFGISLSGCNRTVPWLWNKSTIQEGREAMLLRKRWTYSCLWQNFTFRYSPLCAFSLWKILSGRFSQLSAAKSGWMGSSARRCEGDLWWEMAGLNLLTPDLTINCTGLCLEPGIIWCLL